MSRTRGVPVVAERAGRRGVGGVPEWVLRAVGFVSFFDRFATPPMLLALVAATGLTLGQAVELVAVYYLLYALGQPAWGLLSDRFGRVAVLRLALAGTILGGLASTVFLGHGFLVAARALTGLMVGALYPTLLTLIGDARTGTGRVRSLSGLQVYSALGNTAATLVSGTLAALVDWRLVFALTPLGCLALLAALRGARDAAGGSRPRLRLAFAPPAVGLYALAVLEGAVILGGLAYIVPALQDAGVGVTAAGMLAALYGLGIIVGARIMRTLARRLTRTRIMAVGGAVAVAAYGLSAVSQGPAALTATSLGIALANAILHVSMQGWATEIAPRARATSVSFFVCCLFLGSSLFTFATAPLAQERLYGAIFAWGAGVAAVLAAAAVAGHAAWARRAGRDGGA